MELQDIIGPEDDHCSMGGVVMEIMVRSFDSEMGERWILIPIYGQSLDEQIKKYVSTTISKEQGHKATITIPVVDYTRHHYLTDDIIKRDKKSKGTGL